MSALATARLVESSIDSYFNDSGSMPEVGGRVTTHSPEGSKLLNILLGLDAKSDSAPTTRVLEFRAAKEGKNKKGGIIYAPDRKSVEGLYDPWGSPYMVILDIENKQELHFTMGSKSIVLKGRRSAAFSPGADKQIGTSDDVVTW